MSLTTIFFFFIDPSTTQIYTLSLHDALPIFAGSRPTNNVFMVDNLMVNDYANGSPGSGLGVNLGVDGIQEFRVIIDQDRKSTRLNSSHMSISYAVFCLKKKKTK